MIETITKLIEEIHSKLIDIRHDIHKYPEIKFQVERTAGVVESFLTETGISHNRCTGTGVVAVIGNGNGHTVGLRAELDALPMPDLSGLPYASINGNTAHACGHDGHMAILLTVAKILNSYRKNFIGNIKFVFQPGEEGFAGARLMIEDGVLQAPRVDAAIALHLMTPFPIGSVALCTGPMMASMDSFTVTINGKGGHAAMPEEGADAILMSAQVISALQSLISKEVSPTTPLVVHVGTIHGGNAFNIVADQVELRGTVRTLDEKLRKSIPDRIERIITGMTAALRGTHSLDYRFCYPPVVNDSRMTDMVKRIGDQVVGGGKLLEAQPIMGSDDMGFFLGEVPGCYFFVGAANPKMGFNRPHHNARFDFDEDAV